MIMQNQMIYYVYVRRGTRMMSTENYHETPIVIGGDFNSRVAELNELDPKFFNNNTNFQACGLSADKTINIRGKQLTHLMEITKFTL